MVGDRTFVSNLTAHHGEFKFELFFSHNRQKHAQSSRYHVHLNELRIKNPFPFHLSCYLRKQRARNLNKTHLFLFIFKFELFFSHNRQKHAQSSRYHVHLNELRIKNPFPFHLSCYLRKQRARNLNKTHLFLFILATVGRHIVCVQSTRNSRENCKRLPGCNRYPRLPYVRSATRKSD